MSSDCVQDSGAEEYVNDSSIEMAWAIRAAECASIHMNILISAPDTRNLKLNKMQNEVYKRFRELFVEFDVEKVKEEDLKSATMKEKWRGFCEELKDSIEDYNMGTMMRTNAEGIYDEENTVIVPKIIYLAIEGARNMEGVNEKWKSTYTAKQKSAQASESNHVAV